MSYNTTSLTWHCMTHSQGLPENENEKYSKHSYGISRKSCESLDYVKILGYLPLLHLFPGKSGIL